MFQAFNLVPTLTAEENITLPLALGGRRGDPDWLRTLTGALHLDAGCATVHLSCRAASSSGSRQRGR